MNSRDLLRVASRTFAIGIERLPGVLCEATTVAYLLLRVSDYFEDNEEMNSEEKVGLLNWWVNVLRGEADIDKLTATFNQQSRCHRDTTRQRYSVASAFPAGTSSGDHHPACDPQHTGYGALDKTGTQSGQRE